MRHGQAECLGGRLLLGGLAALFFRICSACLAFLLRDDFPGGSHWGRLWHWSSSLRNANVGELPALLLELAAPQARRPN